MLRAVAFDLWETLITDTPDQAQEQEKLRLTRIRSVLASEGFEVSPEELDHAYRELWHRCHELYWSADVDIPTGRQIVHMVEQLGLDPSSISPAALGQMEHAYSIAALEIPPRLVDGAEEMLASVKAMNLRTGLISNTGRTPGWVLRRILARLRLSRHLDAMVFSNEHGVCKPRRSIFDELCRQLAVDQSEVLFVGDNLYADVHGAKQCGMRAVHFTPPSKGLAVARPVEHGLTIKPDASVSDLSDLAAVISSLA